MNVSGLEKFFISFLVKMILRNILLLVISKSLSGCTETTPSEPTKAITANVSTMSVVPENVTRKSSQNVDLPTTREPNPTPRISPHNAPTVPSPPEENFNPRALEEMIKVWVKEHYFGTNKDEIITKAVPFVGLWKGVKHIGDPVGALEYLTPLTVQYFVTYANILGCFIFGKPDRLRGACISAQILYRPTAVVDLDAVDSVGNFVQYFLHNNSTRGNLKGRSIALSHASNDESLVTGFRRTLDLIMNWTALNNYTVLGISIGPIWINNVVVSDTEYMWELTRGKETHKLLPSTYIHVSRP